MTYLEFKRTLSVTSLEPVYLFYGLEDFLIEEGIRAIIDLSVAPAMRGFNLDVVYGDKVEAKEVVAHAASFPMMGERRVVVIKEFEKMASDDGELKIITAYLHNTLQSTCLVLVTDEKDLKKKHLAEIKKRAVAVECKPLYDNQISPWIRESIKNSGRQITLEACQILHAYVGNSLRALKNEIEKLYISIGERKEITPEDVTRVVGATKGFTIFDLQNTIGRKETPQAVNILERMLTNGESPQYIIVMLTKFFTQLWKLSDPSMRKRSDSELEKELHMPAWLLRQYLPFRSKYSTEEIEQWFSALLKADTVLKTTSRDPHLVLNLVVISCMTGVRMTEDLIT